MFTHFNYLNLNAIDTYIESLKNTYFINFDSIRTELKNCSDSNPDHILNYIHFICLNQLTNYLPTYSNYFDLTFDSTTKYQLDLSLNNTFNNYLLRNIKLFLHLSKEYSFLNTPPLSLVDSLSTYQSNNNLESDINSDFFKSLYDSQYKALKNFIDLNSNNIDFLNIFFKNPIKNKNSNYQIYPYLPNILHHCLSNLRYCPYVAFNKSPSKTYSLNHFKKFNQEFITQDISLIDLYLFDRLFHSSFSIALSQIYEYYNNDIGLLCFPMVYLPNTFDATFITTNLMQLYQECALYRFNTINLYKGIERMCLEVAFYLIPLYNSLFLSCLELYVRDFTDESLISFIDNYIDSPLNNIVSLHPYSPNNLSNLSNLQGGILEETIYCIFENINWRFFSRGYTFTNLNITLPTTLPFSDINNYQSSLKDFITSLISHM